MKKRGFTLIELVMVIVIIGILAAVAIPRFVGLRDEARRARCQADVSAIRTALSFWYAQYHVSVATVPCPSGVAVNCHASGFPVAAQLATFSGTYFATHYFAEGHLPPTSDITAAAALRDWSLHYTPSAGVMNMTTCCP